MSVTLTILTTRKDIFKSLYIYKGGVREPPYLPYVWAGNPGN